jgi:voltage-gated potassium channel
MLEVVKHREARLLAALEWPLAFLALLVVPVLVVEDSATDPQIRRWANIANWTIWSAFCADFILRWRLDGRLNFLRLAWFDLALIVATPPFLVPDAVQGARSLRALSVLRLFRAGALASMGLRAARKSFAGRKFHLVALFAAATVLLGATGVFLLERGTNKSIASFGDALWWSIVTATTVGYGDVSPSTTEGRVIAVFLMLVGIGVIGVFTATVASYFLEQERSHDNTLDARLEAIEKKLDSLLDQYQPPHNK